MLFAAAAFFVGAAFVGAAFVGAAFVTAAFFGAAAFGAAAFLVGAAFVGVAGLVVAAFEVVAFDGAVAGVGFFTADLFPADFVSVVAAAADFFGAVFSGAGVALVLAAMGSPFVSSASAPPVENADPGGFRAVLGPMSSPCRAILAYHDNMTT